MTNLIALPEDDIGYRAALTFVQLHDPFPNITQEIQPIRAEMGPVFGDALKFFGSATYGAVHAQLRVGKIVYTWDTRSQSSPLLTRSMINQRQSLSIPVRVCEVKPAWIKLLQKARTDTAKADSVIDTITKVPLQLIMIL